MKIYYILPALALGALLAGCGVLPVPGQAAPAVPVSVPTPPPSKDADRAVCIDLDARGGQLYSTFIVPMMAGPGGATSVDINLAQLTRAVTAVAQVGEGHLTDASPDVADAGERMVAAADAFQAVDNAEGTALLTSFVRLSVACQQAGHKPSWFDAQALAR